MSQEKDLVLGGEDTEEDIDMGYDLLKVIDSQIIIINECREWADDLFDSMPEYRVKLALMAFKIISKCQKNLMDQI